MGEEGIKKGGGDPPRRFPRRLLRRWLELLKRWLELLHQRLAPWWPRARWLFVLVEIVAAAKDTTAPALMARAVVLVGDTIWPSN